MKQNRILLLLVVILTFMFPLIPTVFTANGQTRNNTVWACGYQTKAEDFMPYTNDPAYGVAFMYEPLFGYNFLSDEKIPVIGTDYEWSTDGTSITVDLNTNAKWSDGEKIDADDVVYSYTLAANTTKFGADMKKRIDKIEKIDDNTVKFTLKSDFYWSSKLEEWLINDVFIVPKHIWEDIIDENPVLDDFNNDWFDSSFNDDWKVCSGPYIPYSRTSTMDEEIYVRRDDWWGKGRIHTDLPDTKGNPQAKYIGLRQYPGNIAQDTALLTGEIDLHAGYYDKIWIGMGQNSYIKTWYGNAYPYYLGLAAVIEIAFNHLRYPLVETWLREALAYALDYEEIAYISASGYWARARQGFVDNRSATHISVYNATIQEMYGIDYNITKTKEILDEHCYFQGGVWYTDDVPSQYLGMPGATDDDGGTPGINVKLGGWEILVPTGWSDVVKATKLWAEYFTAANISCTKKEIDFESAFQPKLTDSAYDLAMQCCAPHLINPPLTFLGGLRGTHQWNSNVTNWNNPEFNSLYESFETLKPGSTEQLQAASRMQYLLATEIPSIPTHANGFWYAYSTQYWEGWVSQENPYNQACTAYIVNQAAVKQRLILNLKPTGATAEDQIVPWSGLIVFAIIGITAVAIIVKYKLKNMKKKS
ncbi:MAG: ABC transporter substrate-binding protein [Promethearchaeota archaeon]